jgi:hypothetical protein
MREQEISAVLGYEGVNTAHSVTGMGSRPDLADTGIAALSGYPVGGGAQALSSGAGAVSLLPS